MAKVLLLPNGWRALINPPPGMVELREASLFHIVFENEPAYWKCRSKDPNKMCGDVQEGKLTEEGKYLVTKSGIPLKNL